MVASLDSLHWSVARGGAVGDRLTFSSSGRAASMAAAIDAARDLASNGSGGGAVGAGRRVGESMDSAERRVLALTTGRWYTS